MLIMEHPIVFFDGVCGLCNQFVDFVLRYDRNGQFRFAALQGETARDYVDAEDISRLKTVVLVDGRGTHRRSGAVVRVLWRLGGIWRIVAAMMWIIPPPLRDTLYRCVARFRYRIFGRRAACRIPTAFDRERLLP